MREQVFCYDCGDRCRIDDRVPVCDSCGPRWRLVRNAPAAGVLLVRDDTVLLAQRAHEPWTGYWAIPGGFVDLGEHPEDAARREMREELGVETVISHVLGVYLRQPPGSDWIQTTLYLGVTNDEPAVADGEVLAVRWFHLGALPDRLVPGDEERIGDYMNSRPDN